MSGNARLSNLLELATQGAAMRAALTEEVAELLTAWPADCPMEMRGPCEALLARAAQEVDDETKARLRVRLYADPGLAARILPREALDSTLVEIARGGEGLSARIARALGISEKLAREILSDQSGHALAVAAKALGLNRAAFSSLVLLATASDDIGARYRQLDGFDALSAVEAARELRQWSGQSHIAA